MKANSIATKSAIHLKQPTRRLAQQNPRLRLAAWFCGLFLVTAACAQPFDSDNWEGNAWAFNNNIGTWFPSVGSGTASFASPNDFTWVKLRTKTNYTGSVRTTLEINPSLLTGGVNGDAAYLAYGDQWIEHVGQPAVGVLFRAGGVYFYDQAAGKEQQQIGSYVAGQWVQLTLDYSLAGLLQVVGTGISGSYQTTNILTSFKFIIACKDSTDGFQVRNLSTTARSSIQPLDSGTWIGNHWSANVNLGPWWPSVTNDFATFAIDDYSWGQIRTVSNYSGAIRATFEVNPSLTSGGVNGDDAILGFGQHWIYYHENPVGEWVPGPGPASLGVMFRGGNIFVVDGYGSSTHVEQLIGTYVPGHWIPMTMDLNERGVLRVSAPSISAEYQWKSPLSTFRFIAAMGNSADGIRLKNVALGPSGYIGTSLGSALYFGLQIQEGVAGQVYNIQTAPSLTPPATWTTSATFTQSPAGFLWVDTNSPANAPKKFYRVVP